MANDIDPAEADQTRRRPFETGVVAFVATLAIIGVAAGGWIYATDRIPATPTAEVYEPTITESKTIMAMDTPASKPGQMWVTTERAERYTCTATSCGAVGKLYFRESAVVLEKRDGFARITEMYGASCEGGKSSYVDRGNAKCTAENGIIQGRFAEWISLASLSEDRPADPAAMASSTEKLVAQSDDFKRYRAAFVKGANELIASGACTEKDFVNMGGWVKSTKSAGQPVYFVYCGGGNVPDRWYLKAATGATYK